ncbi:UDP-GalNAc:beta-1,3-N-acetylgalactosaminyltransferase 1-like [Micropterus salmoides]|uniref:UDP-GalNAc:beta-1, 3-N-acetylgalactosaminyltransferase 1-like n=1 Tax=Micropterus salmoides TaxID=27706 RepID=UPI0018EB182D|nr:UDP-GalNAc:beta-1,3-N-acetylgalactosaminyltransferase 1-like [Micropterus salmoides]
MEVLEDRDDVVTGASMVVNFAFLVLLDNLAHQKKTLFHSWFRFLLLLSLVVFILLYAVSDTSLSWWTNLPLHVHYQRFFNLTNKVNQAPSYRIHPKHKVKLSEIHETTEHPTVPATGIQYHQAYPRNYHKTKTPFHVLMVPVAPNNVAARDAIRQTWGKESLVQGEVVLTLFMLGISGKADAEQLQEKLKQENLKQLW